MPQRNSHTSALFHYTRNQKNIFSILKEGLKFSYCKEKLTDNLCLGIPMISFCDIPIEDSAEHSSKYGGYAIGLSKDYLLKEYSIALGPVNYFTSDRVIRASFKLKEEAKRSKKTLDEIGEKSNGKVITVIINGKKYKGKSLPNNMASEALRLFFQGEDYYRSATWAIGLMKPYSSIRHGKLQINYDECEWRMVMPENAKLGDGRICKWFWSEQDYDKWRDTTTNKFIQEWSLPFSVDNIQYIIIPTQELIPNFIMRLTKLKNLCGTSLTEKDKYSLVSKVFSMDQIKKDF